MLWVVIVITSPGAKKTSHDTEENWIDITEMNTWVACLYLTNNAVVRRKHECIMSTWIRRDAFLKHWHYKLSDGCVISIEIWSKRALCVTNGSQYKQQLPWTLLTWRIFLILRRFTSGLKQAKSTSRAKSKTSWLCSNVLNFLTRHCVCVSLPVDTLLSIPTLVSLMIS
jgi:hypothetical protein